MDLADKRAARQRARGVPAATQAESNRVVEALEQWLRIQPVSGVLVYLSMPGEIAAEDLAGRIPHPLFTTRTPDEGPLTVHRFDAPREQHQYGFLQPARGVPQADLDDIGIVLVPGLAFGRDGSRLGRGKGYYDRLLSSLPGRAFVGVTLARSVLGTVPVEAHDVLMTHLATEMGVIRIEVRGSG